MNPRVFKFLTIFLRADRLSDVFSILDALFFTVGAIQLWSGCLSGPVSHRLKEASGKTTRTMVHKKVTTTGEKRKRAAAASFSLGVHSILAGGLVARYDTMLGYNGFGTNISHLLYGLSLLMLELVYWVRNIHVT